MKTGIANLVEWTIMIPGHGLTNGYEHKTRQYLSGYMSDQQG